MSIQTTGAVAAAEPDEALAWHYGDPFREQRSIADGAALVDRSNRGVITVSGPDRLGWLHSLTTQHLAALAPLTGTETLVLSPHGHVEHHLVLHDDGATTWIDVEPGTSAALVAYLDSMRFMLRVDVADVTDQWAVRTVAGSEAASRFDLRPSGVVALPGGGFARARPTGPDGVDLVVPRDGAAPSQVADLPPAGLWAWEATRVEAGRPRLGFETDHRTIPHEVGWIGTAVHLDKGCYRGQETVARVQNLGRPPRRLVLLHLDGSDDRLPARDDPVVLLDGPGETAGDGPGGGPGGGTAVGRVTTPVRHHELGPIALAVVKRATPDGARLLAGGIAAAATPIVVA